MNQIHIKIKGDYYYPFEENNDRIYYGINREDSEHYLRRTTPEIESFHCLLQEYISRFRTGTWWTGIFVSRANLVSSSVSLESIQKREIPIIRLSFYGRSVDPFSFNDKENMDLIKKECFSFIEEKAKLLLDKYDSLIIVIKNEHEFSISSELPVSYRRIKYKLPEFSVMLDSKEEVNRKPPNCFELGF